MRKGGEDMSLIKVEDILGYFVREECVCCKCVGKDEAAAAPRGEIITRVIIDDGDDVYFCDRCKEQIR